MLRLFCHNLDDRSRCAGCCKQPASALVCSRMNGASGSAPISQAAGDQISIAPVRVRRQQFARAATAARETAGEAACDQTSIACARRASWSRATWIGSRTSTTVEMTDRASPCTLSRRLR
jgi:hypothetical protein